MKRKIAVGAAVSALLLSGCSTVSQAVDSADSLIRVGTDLAAACTAAQAAWVPGVTPEGARSAIDEALGLVDGVLADAPNAPGAEQLDQALTSARDALAADPSSTSLGVSRQALETACALISLGG